MQLVMSTCASTEEAESLGRRLVEERLAACATVLPNVISQYWWGSRLERETECLLLLKTTSDRVPALQVRLLELHSYECPEVLVLRVESANPAYEEWVRTSVR